MERIEKATLSSGETIEYIMTDAAPAGSMKQTYFTPDRKHVVQFYKNRGDPFRRERLEAIVGRFNPTLSEAEGGAVGNDRAIADYFARRFCWPMAIVEQPRFGIVCPAYPSDFFFAEGAFTRRMAAPFDRQRAAREPFPGEDKKSVYFTDPNKRKKLKREECGNFKNMLKIALLLARSVRKMHMSGLTHSDLSCNNVLIDPKHGNCVVIDIDSLMVPGIYAPEVWGSTSYMAPELVEMRSSGRTRPDGLLSIKTDRHSLAVLIYEYLFLRHPLKGPARHSLDKAVNLRDQMGEKAVFIENPHDDSNARDDLYVTIHDMGPDLERLFLRAFVEGLHHPSRRPTAPEWEQGLARAWNLLHPCRNPRCEAGWFILYDAKRPVCPFCGTRADSGDFVRVRLNAPIRGKQGQWRPKGELNVYGNMPLFRWHMLSDEPSDEKADPGMKAYVCRRQGKWLLVNYDTHGMLAPDGSIVPRRSAILLKNSVFRICGDERSFLYEVTL